MLRQAISDASGIFAEVGVELVCELSDPDAEEAHTLELNSSAFVRANRLRNRGMRSYVAVRIGRGMSGQTPIHALGMSLPDAQNGTNATIFEDRIENYLCVSSGLNLALTLGHVITHELGHFLLGIPEHATTGVMRARWGKADFDDAATGRLRFSLREGAAIRNHDSLRAGSRVTEIPLLAPLNPGLEFGKP